MKLRSVAKLLGGLIALVILVMLLLPMFISADYLKAQLAAQVKQATGRELTIRGKASLSLFPNVAVHVEDVTLGNPAGFASPYFISVKKLETGAALRPLLAKDLQITGITLEGAVVNLEENAQGAKNWEFPLEAAKAQEKENVKKQEAASTAASPLSAFTLGDVALKDSAVTYLKAGAKPVVAKDISVTVSGADGSKPLAVDASANYQGAPVKLQLSVEQLKTALEGKSTPVNMALSLPNASLKFDGKASFKDRPNADGALAISVADLPGLLAWATDKPASAGLPKQVDLKSTLALKGTQAATLSDLELKVDALSASGKLALNLADAVPSLQGALTLGSIDLDTLFAPTAISADTKGAAVAKTPAAATPQGWSDAPIDVSGLRAVNAVLDLTVEALHSGTMDVSDIAANVALTNGTLNVKLAHASLYGGTAKGTVTLDGSGAGLGVETDLGCSGVNIEPLMTAVSGKSRLAGTGNLTMALRSRGASERALVSALEGKGTIRVTDGAVKGVNIAQLLRNLKQGALFADGETQSTDFSELSASYAIAQGILSNTDLAMKSPVLRVAGSGTVNLPLRSLNYRLVPTLVGSLEGQGGKDAAGLAVPLLITGPWSSPSVTPDVKGIITQGLKNPQALKQNLKDIKGSFGKFNSPKDIGKALLGGPSAAPATDAAPSTDAAPQNAATPPTPAQKAIGGLLKGLDKH